MNQRPDAETVAGWKLARCWAGKGVKEDEERLDALLHAGWEPFAVTSSGQAGYTYHLRLPVEWGKEWAQIDGDACP